MASQLDRAETAVMRGLISSSVISKIADYGLALIVPLAVLATTGSAAQAIFTIALRGIAYVASPSLGSIVDRFDRRTVFVLSQVQQAVCIAVAALFLGQPYVVAAMVLLSGLGGVTASITGQFVLIPELISQPNRPVAVARLASAIEFAKVAGLLIAGVVLWLLPPGYAAWLVAILYFAAGLVAMRLPAVSVAPGQRSLWADMKVGFSWLVKPEIGWLVASLAISNLAIGGLEPVLVTIMGAGNLQPTIISGTLAAGLLIGAFGARLTPKVLARQSTAGRILVFQLLAGLGFLIIILEVSYWSMIMAYAGLCFALGLSNVVSISFRQESIPVPLAGRVNSVIRMFIAGAIPLSGFIYAWGELRGIWIWLPALVLEAASLLIWGSYVLVNRARRPPDARSAQPAAGVNPD